MIRRHAATLHLALAAADATSATLLFVVLSIVRFGDRWQVAWAAAGIDGSVAALLYGLAWAGMLWLQGLYRLRARWSLRREALDIVVAGLLFAVAVFAALFWFKLPDVSRLFLISLFPAQVALTVGSRAAIRFVFARARERGFNLRYVLVVGANRSAEAFASRLERHADLGLRVIGHLAAPGDPASYRPSRPVVGALDDIEEVLHRTIVDEVALCLEPDAWPYAEAITHLCEDEGRIVRIPLEGGLSVTGGHQDELDGQPILSLVYGPDRAIGLAAKGALDVALAVVGLVVLSPLFLGIAAAILVLDGRPVFFRQERVGLHGRPFRVLKFRTMVPDAEDRLGALEALNEIAGHAFKLSNDPRITRTGRWLRRTSLDELPQLWNVVRGEMSLVGPRPPLPREVAGYDIWHRRRLSMKPGMTGLWQVAARHEPEFDRWVRLDLDYIDRWSFWLDLKIILRTIPAMLSGR